MTNDLPGAIDALIGLCVDRPELSAFAVASEADGHCGVAVDIFTDLASQLLPETQTEEVHFVAHSRWHKERHSMLAGIAVLSYRHARHGWYRGACRWPGHVVARIDDWLVDWTARQFNPNAPFPLVFRFSECVKEASR
jgi:hypothetical protein